MQKSQRSWAIRVDGLEPQLNGTYQRCGARNGMPLYVKGGSCAVYCSAKEWRLVELGDPDLTSLDLEKQSLGGDRARRNGAGKMEKRYENT